MFMNELCKTCHDRIMLLKDDIEPPTIVYQFLLLDLLNVFYVNKLDLRLILNDFELVNNLRKRKKFIKILMHNEKQLCCQQYREILNSNCNEFENRLLNFFNKLFNNGWARNNCTVLIFKIYLSLINLSQDNFFMKT